MRIDEHRPVNVVAAKVTSEACIDNKFDGLQDVVNRGQGIFWKSPRVGVVLTSSELNQRDFTDFTGLKIFRSKVINYQGRSRWQLKCVCGNYYNKKAKKIKEGKPEDLICFECRRRYELMAKNEFRITGFDKHDINWYILNR